MKFFDLYRMRYMNRNKIYVIPWNIKKWEILFLLLLIRCYPNVWQAWWVNAGLVELNYGFMTEREELVAKGQTMLYYSHTSRYHHMSEAEFDPDNLLVNGGFEFNGYGWVIGGPCNPRWVDDVAHSGFQSLVVSFDGGDVNFYHTYQDVLVQPDTCYRLEAYIRAEGLTDGVALDVWDADRGYVHWYGGQTQKIKGTVNWSPVALKFCTDSDVRRVQIHLRRYGGRGLGVFGSAWFDDVRLSLLDSGGGYQ